MKNLLQKISDSISSLKGAKVGLAVSGGIDSMVMLDVFNKLKNKFNLNLYILHYNHKWRKESYLDASLVKKYCHANKINFIYEETKGKVVKDEETARDQRHLFFKKAMKKHKLKVVCTAHHKDDQVETILFRLARGTGPSGLMPMKKEFLINESIKLFRPMLEFMKSEIKQYAKNNKISYIEDLTNLDVKYKRNLIRLKVIPALKKVNPEVVSNILNCSELIYSNSVVLDEYFCFLCRKLFLKKINLKKLSDKKEIIINRISFLKLDLYTQKSFIYWLLSVLNIKGNVSKIELFRDTVVENGKIDFGHGFLLSSLDNKIILSEKSKSVILADKKNGEKTFFYLNGKEKNIILKDNSQFILKSYSNKSFDFKFPPDSKKVVYVNLSNYSGKNLTLRYRQPKDVFQPLGYSHKTKLKSYFINKKISSETRYNLPLLCFGKEILWLPGYSLSEKLKVTKKPTHILMMRKYL